MISFVAWLPALFSSYVAFFRSPERAFVSVFIPVLLLLPQIFYAQTVGFPKLNFSETCIIPIFISFLFFRFRHWKFSLMDFLVVSFIGCSFYSEMRTSDAHYAINKLATALCTILAPYALAKQLIHPLGLSEKLAKRIVFLMFINVLIAFWEMRFVSVPQITIFQPFFPDTSSDWPALYRYGLTRIRGPFVQAIIFGIGLTVAILLNYWLVKMKRWPPNFKYLPGLPLKKGTLLMLFLCFGLLMTFSRGPWISCFIGLLFAKAAFSTHPFRNYLINGCLAALTLLLLYEFFSSSTEINPLLAKTDTEANIAYRGEIYRRYMELTYQSPTWGWGTLEQPFLHGFRSIDNQYLLVLLQKGAVGLTLYVAMIVCSTLSLFFHGLKMNSQNFLQATLAFTLLNTLLAMALSFATVFMGLQVETLFFLILGWAEGVKRGMR